MRGNGLGLRKLQRGGEVVGARRCKCKCSAGVSVVKVYGVRCKCSGVSVVVYRLLKR